MRGRESYELKSEADAGDIDIASPSCPSWLGDAVEALSTGIEQIL